MHKRYLIVAVTAAAALLMYIDRVCVSTVAGDIQRDLGLSKWERAYALGAFFVTYALFQIPVGAMADRWGPRRVLAACILGWSVVTALTGLVTGFVTLLLVRLLLGVSEAGAYPAAAGLVKRWARPEERGRFSSIVAAGGRIGNAISPFLTRWLTVAFVGVGLAWWTSVPPDGQPARNWRAVFVFYGLCGVAVAAVFWLVVSDRPPATAGVNISWAFLITKFPEYLERLKVPDQEVGRMQSAVLGIGACGMLVGGYITDVLRRKLGPKLGRSVPIAVALLGCAIACAATVPLTDPWTIVAVLGLMAFLVDIHNPAIWSFAQDVGGKNVGASLGWGNMWGNLGAAVSPVLLTVVEDQAGWSALFVVCSGSFVIAGVCALMLDATRPVDPDDA